MKQKKVISSSDQKVFDRSESSFLGKRDDNVFYERMSVCLDDEDNKSAKSFSSSSVFSMKRKEPKNSFSFF